MATIGPVARGAFSPPVEFVATLYRRATPRLNGGNGGKAVVRSYCKNYYVRLLIEERRNARLRFARSSKCKFGKNVPGGCKFRVITHRSREPLTRDGLVRPIGVV
jgi:hypothetical protein